MKREIKFRAYKRGKMYYNIGLHPHICMDHTKQEECDITFIDSKTTHDGHLTLWNTDDGIMQFTGLKDKNGVDIYEGDIVKCVHTEGYSWEKTYTDIGVVEYTDRAAFAVKCPKKGCENAKDISKRFFFLSFHKDKSFEAIGNIHQNPDLL